MKKLLFFGRKKKKLENKKAFDEDQYDAIDEDYCEEEAVEANKASSQEKKVATTEELKKDLEEHTTATVVPGSHEPHVEVALPKQGSPPLSQLHSAKSSVAIGEGSAGGTTVASGIASRLMFLYTPTPLFNEKTLFISFCCPAHLLKQQQLERVKSQAKLNKVIIVQQVGEFHWSNHLQWFLLCLAARRSCELVRFFINV